MFADAKRLETGETFTIPSQSRGNDISGRDNPDERRIDFLKAKLEGTAHARELSDIYAERLGLPREDLFSYLTENISYDLDGESLEGLKLYYQLARECRLIEGPRDIVFLV